jgi:hypothetical protein
MLDYCTVNMPVQNTVTEKLREINAHFFFKISPCVFLSYLFFPAFIQTTVVNWLGCVASDARMVLNCDRGFIWWESLFVQPALLWKLRTIFIGISGKKLGCAGLSIIVRIITNLGIVPLRVAKSPHGNIVYCTLNCEIHCNLHVAYSYYWHVSLLSSANIFEEELGLLRC